MKQPEIKPYQPAYLHGILSVWEESVLATHHFLSEKDFQALKQLVASIDFSALDVFCLLDNDRVIGFLGVSDASLEMLFLAPDQHGKGLGRKLLEFAIRELKVHKVDVNEQNEAAVGFYQRFGFATYERTAKDPQGMDYPILKMKLDSRSQS